jgi:hypothetical protein
MQRVKMNFKTVCIVFVYCQLGSDVTLKSVIMAAWIIVLETETFAHLFLWWQGVLLVGREPAAVRT